MRRRVDPTTRLRPGDGRGGAGIGLVETSANLYRPRGLGVRVNFVVEALDELTGKRGSLFVRELQGLSE